MISYKWFSHSEAQETIIREIQGLFDMKTLLFGIKDVIWRPLCFQNKESFPIHLHFVQI